VSGTGSAPVSRQDTAPLRRRLASLVYEALLLFGIAFGVGMVYGIVTQQHHALQGRRGLLAAQFFVFGLYFVWCWARSGQTLPMQTWKLRLVSADGGPVSFGRALARYLLAWLWCLPALAAVWLLDWQQDKARSFAAVAAGVVVYATLTRVLPQRQFLHDLIAGTRLVSLAGTPSSGEGRTSHGA
jgi:uncharacterized RDD family membrane protein YckC